MKITDGLILLHDKTTEPTTKVLEDLLPKELFLIYQDLISIFTDEFKLKYHWQFSKDGQAWLCKVVDKNKTILWLSIWANYIKTGFYFSQKTAVGVLNLAIDNKIKEVFKITKPIGKLIPLIIDIEHKGQIKDLKELIKYKKGLK